jgi:hypothetical protein
MFRSLKLSRCLEMNISELLDLAPLPSGDIGESCIPFFIEDGAFPIKKNLANEDMLQKCFELQVYWRSEEC